MPYLAVIHPWNRMRIQRSNIRFISASKIVPLIAREAFEFNGYSGKAGVKVRVRKGESIQYLRNDAEGSFEIKLNGRQYTANQDLFEHVNGLGDSVEEDDWALMTCENGQRAYLLLADLSGTDSKCMGGFSEGISEVGPGQTGYAKARDLTAAEALELETARQTERRASETCLQDRAKKGDLETQFELAKYYYQGTNSSSDKAKAAAWFKTAADRGHVGAQSYLALMYMTGQGVEKSSESAIELYERAAKGGDLSSAHTLAVFFKTAQE
jgi:Sel1 repeat